MNPDFIKCVRDLRMVRNIGYEEAKQLTIAAFQKRGWEIPRAFQVVKGEK